MTGRRTVVVTTGASATVDASGRVTGLTRGSGAIIAARGEVKAATGFWVGSPALLEDQP